VRGSALGALSIPLFAQDYGNLFAQSSGHPVLTIANLNAFLQRIQGQGPAAPERSLVSAQTNLEQLLTSNFTLNPKQLEAFRTAFSERRLQFEDFIKAGLSQLRQRRTLAPMRAEFAATASPYIRIFGFGKELQGCKNEKLGALKRAPQKNPVADCIAVDCAFVMDCGSGCE
jgi:hypothetical protein